MLDLYKCYKCKSEKSGIFHDTFYLKQSLINYVKLLEIPVL